jgi:hypothetical protein
MNDRCEYDTLDEVPWNSVAAVTSATGNTVGIDSDGFSVWLTGPRTGQRIPLDAHGPWWHEVAAGLSCSPDDYEDHDAYAHAMATLAALDTDKDEWAIGGEDPESPHTETEYAVEPMRGDCARGHDSELAGLIDELPIYAAGARLITREITYGPWRYVTPEEIIQSTKEN